MKHKLKFLTVVIVFTIFIFASCTQTTETKTKTTITNNNNTEEEKAEAEAKAEEFFKEYNNQNFDKIHSFTYKTFQNQIKGILPNTFEFYNKNISFEKYNTKILDDGSIDFYYECKFTKSEKNVFLLISIYKDDNEYKILGLSINPDKDIIDNRELVYNKAKDVAEKFYQYLKNDETDNISKLLDKKILIDAGYEQEFLELIQKRRDYYGIIIEHDFENSSLIQFDNSTAFILTFKSKTEKDEIYEQILLIKRNNGFKIFNYKYAKTIEEFKDL